MGVLMTRRPEEAAARPHRDWIQLLTNSKSGSSENVEEGRAPSPSMEEVLPFHIQVEVLNWVKDARDLANCMAASKTMHDAVQYVHALNLVCRKRYYELARERNPVRPPCSHSDDEDDDETDSDESSEYSEEDEDCCGRSGPSRSPPNQFSPQDIPLHVSFKQACWNMLRRASRVEQLRIEIEPEMQANPFLKDEIHMVDFWLSEPMFVRRWLSCCSQTLQHLSLVDYGQQAIMRQTPILRILAEQCKGLRTLELRNMYLDTEDLGELPNVTCLTLRCIKMSENSLTDITNCMPGLETLALVSVFGVQEARIVSNVMRVLCLGLSTSARVVDLQLPNIRKLQLKMTCPDFLRVVAPSLAYVAVCMEKRDGAEVQFEQVTNLKELLFGASHFGTLSKLIKSNPMLEKIFLDVPCMALGEDGSWEGVLRHVPLRLPNVKALEDSCPLLHTMSIGPGLWHSMEVDYETKQELTSVRKWPALQRLIVHMIIQSLETCLAVLQWIISALPTLRTLEIYVHSDSRVDREVFLSSCQEQVKHTAFKSGTWKKSLCFACFSF